MTVAVANRRVMLADTRTSNGNAHIDCGKIDVIEIKRERFVICGAGDGADCQLFVEHFKRFQFAVPEEPWAEGFEALVLCARGVYHVDAKGSAGLARRGWATIGSGGDLATGCIGGGLGDENRQPTLPELYRGMHTAFRYNGDCGGDIDEAWLHERKKR